MKTGMAAAIALVGILVSGAALADGNKLLEVCQQAVRAMDKVPTPSIDLLGVGRCIGMVEGVRNTMVIFKSALPDNLKVCFPKQGINNGQATRILEKFLHDNPAMLDQDETFLTIMAFKQAYPCE
ncbi:Rap1a/Tai family immunity protein [Pseudomonas sp. CLCA07]